MEVGPGGSRREAGRLRLSLGDHAGVLWRHREGLADTLQMGCSGQGIWHFCHRALAGPLTAFCLPAGKSAGEKG
jgi:hypothetical protein